MKLAEALIERAHLQLVNIELVKRIEGNLRLPDDEEPTSIPEELLKVYDAKMARLQDLVRQINTTNALTKMESGDSIAAALARRDCLTSQIRVYKEVYGELTSHDRFEGYNRENRVKYVRHADFNAMNDKINQMCQELRILDTAIQEKNWTVELLE